MDSSIIKISIIIPTYNEAKIIREKINNTLHFMAGIKRVADCNFIIVDNGSTDETVAIAENFPDVKIIKLGRVGKFEALRTASKCNDSDWVMLSDANTMITDFNVDQLAQLFKNNEISLLYGKVKRGGHSVNPRLGEVKSSSRLRLDEMIGLSSGAYGALYFIRQDSFISCFRNETIQNDDLFIAVMVHNSNPKIAQIIVEEVEDIGFKSELKRKMRDSRGHWKCFSALAKFAPRKNFYYALAVRGSIWSGIILLEILLLYFILNYFILSVLLLTVIALTEKGGIYLGRCLGFTLGFFDGIFRKPVKTWDTDRL